jgi:hypothetical protein
MNQATLYYHKGTVPQCPKRYALLPAEETKYNQLNPEYQKQYHNRRMWLKSTIKHHGFDEQALCFKPSQKPYFSQQDAYISITHQADLWAVMLSNFPIGIDYQQTLPHNPKKFAAYFNIEQTDILHDWMIREACAKLLDISVLKTRRNSSSALIIKHQLHLYELLPSEAPMIAVSTCNTLQISTTKLQTLF